jgi:hypothetical protein
MKAEIGLHAESRRLAPSTEDDRLSTYEYSYPRTSRILVESSSDQRTERIFNTRPAGYGVRGTGASPHAPRGAAADPESTVELLRPGHGRHAEAQQALHPPVLQRWPVPASVASI